MEDEEPTVSSPRLHPNTLPPPERRRRPVATASKAMEEEKGFQPYLMGGDGRMRGATGAMGLHKQNLWSPVIEQDEARERRQRGILGKGRRSPLQRAYSVTDDQHDELRCSLNLGFRFDPPSQHCAAYNPERSRLVEMLSMLDLLYTVNVAS